MAKQRVHFEHLWPRAFGDSKKNDKTFATSVVTTLRSLSTTFRQNSTRISSNKLFRELGQVAVVAEEVMEFRDRLL